MRFRSVLLGLAAAAAFLSGCIGFNPPHLTEMKPYTYVKGGDQFGRDQLANRWMVAELKIPLKGKDANEVISLLGQPQEVEVKEHKISEDWYFIYYKRYKTWPDTPEGSFLVRLYHDKVIDVVKLE